MNIPEIVRAYTRAADPQSISAAATRGDDNIVPVLNAMLEGPKTQEQIVRAVWGSYTDTLWGTGNGIIGLAADKDGMPALIMQSKTAGFKSRTRLGAAVLWTMTLGALRQKSGIKVPTNAAGVQMPYGSTNVVLPGMLCGAKSRKEKALLSCQEQVMSLLAGTRGKVNKDMRTLYVALKSDILGPDESLHDARLEATTKATGFSKLQLLNAMAALSITAYSAADTNTPAVSVAERAVVEYICANWHIGGTAYTQTLPSSLYLVDSWSMFPWWEHQVSPQEVVFAFLLIKAAQVKSLLRLEQIGGTTRLHFESNYLDVCADGVYDDRRRRFNNSLVVSNQLRNEPSADDLFLVNGFGTALLAFVNNAFELGTVGGSTVSKVGSWYKAITSGSTYPLDSEEESGGVADRGDRLHYSMGLAKTVVATGKLPFTFTSVGAVLATNDVMEAFQGSKASLDYGAFDRGLTRMHKGEMPFIPASMIGVQLKHFPADAQDDVLKYVVKRLHPDLSVAAGLKKLFPEFANWQDTAIIKRVKEQLYLGQSTKLAKISKRVGVAYPKHAEPLEGEDRAFRRYGQVVGNAPGHTYNIAFCRRAVYTPGATIQLVESLKPVVNKHSYQQEFEFYNLDSVCILGQAIKLVNNRCELDFSGESSEVAGTKAPGRFVLRDEAVAIVPYASADGKVAINQFINMPEEGVLLKAVCCLNNFGALKVTLQYATIERVGKLRSNVKSLPCKTLTGKGCLYNDHNETLNLPEGIELVVPGDADKSKDLMESLLDVAAQTAMHSPQGRAKIAALNAAIGVSDSKGLVYSPAAAVLGIYDSFLQEFEADYGADIWLYHRDCKDNIVKAIKELYLNKANAGVGNWRVVKAGSSKQLLAHGFEDALVLANGDPDVLTTDVLVFYTLDGGEYPEVFYQRTYGYIGSHEKGHVKLNLKFELSSVAQAVSHSKLMASVIRAVATGLSGVPGDLEGAKALTRDCDADMQTFIRFKSMYARRPLTTDVVKLYFKKLNKKFVVKTRQSRLPVVNCFTQEWALTPELVALLTKADLLTKCQEASLTLGDLAASFQNVVFRLPSGLAEITPDLFLPAIAAKDLKAASSESLSGLILTLFRLLIVAAHSAAVIDLKAITSRIRRICGAFRSLMESEGFIKALSNGRLSAQCKLLGIFGIPVGEMWVLKSTNPNSFYQYLKQVFRKQGWSLTTGSKVGVARSPMPFFAGVEVVVINDSDPRAHVLNDYQAGVSPLLCYINAGDHDGDDFVSCPANDVKCPVADYDLVMRVIEDRIGANPLDVKVGTYIADHYSIKKYVPLNCWSEANVGLLVRTPDENMPTNDALEIKRKGLKTMVWHATKLQQGHIGQGHEYAYTAECAISIVASVKEVLTADESLLLSSWLKDAGLTLPLYESYENPLGGFDWSAWDALEVILGVMNGSKPAEDINVEALIDNLSNGGMAGGRANDFLSAAIFVKHAREKGYPVADKCSIVDFVQIAAEIMFLIGKADFKPFTSKVTGFDGKLVVEPNSHAAMAACFLAWQPARRRELTKHSILLQVVEKWLLTVGRAVDPYAEAPVRKYNGLKRRAKTEPTK